MEENRLQHIDELTVKYLSGQATEAEIAELRSALTQDKELAQRFTQMREVWFSSVSREVASSYDVEEAWIRFLGRTRFSATKTLSSFIKSHSRNIIRYAVVVAAVIMVSWFSYHRGADDLKSEFADIIIEAPMGSRTSLFLPDSTQVWLNAGSRLTYSQGFGVDDRHVSLSGEGFFYVAHNEKLPFVVTSENLEVKVLGTEFNFRDYPNDAEAVVALQQGKVQLSNLVHNEPQHVLKPGQRVVLDKTSGLSKLETFTAKNLTQWIHGYLFFDEELLSDIAKRLERSYNVEITITDENLGRQRFYANFTNNYQTINEVLEDLSSAGNFSYTIIDGRKAIITNKK